MQETLTSAEAAALLGVSPSSVKRWVDEGALAAERTVGGHRRIRRDALDSFRATLAERAARAEAGAGELVDLLLADTPPQEVEARLLALRAAAGSAGRLAERLAPAIHEIGARWERAAISVVDEHLASERLARALARLVEWAPLGEGAPRALLGTPPGEEHTLGLSLVELCLREADWSTRWSGRSAPLADLVAHVREAAPPLRLVAVSASVYARDARALALVERRLGEACRERGARLVLGGSGAWPEAPR